MLSVMSDGGSALTFSEADDNPRATFGMSADGNSRLTLIDEDGKPIWSAP